MPGAEGGRWPGVLAGAALALLLLFVLWLAAGPLTTNDLWWHLRHGQAFVTEGLWPAADPCLHTAVNAPAPHQWLFAVSVWAIGESLGLHGLRVAHGLAVLGIVWLVLSVFRRSHAGLVAALLAAAVFVVLSWYRVVQLRPELLSIAAVLVLQRLLFERDAALSWSRVAIAAAVVAVWANVHTVFMVGPFLMVVALGGLLVEVGLIRRVVGAPVPADTTLRLQRLAAALGLSLLAALANPRGIDQHLSFVDASREGAIFNVLDEWARFDPFGWTNHAPAVSALAWGVADLLGIVFATAVAFSAVRFFRAPTTVRLRALDPMGLALGVAGAVAMLASIRFFWLSVFPLLWLLRAGRSRFASPATAWLAAAGCAGLALAYPLWGGWATVASVLPREPARWLSLPYTEHRFFETGVRFLEETGLEGNLYNSYSMGGFLCYRLAPRLRTFIDGSMNLPAEVQQEYRRVAIQRGVEPFETWLDLLDRRGVDVFFGVGVPAPGDERIGDPIYTTARLERTPGWLLVSRGMRHGIYLRANDRNWENLRRITDWYAEQGVPFDPSRGLDPERVIEAAPDWAVSAKLVPPRWREMLEARDGAAAGGKAGPFESVGLVYALNGAYEAQLDNDVVAARRAPRAKGPQRRLVWALLRLGRSDEAMRHARTLMALDPDDPRSKLFARAAARYQRAASRPTPDRETVDPVPPDAWLNELPLLTSRNPLRQ